jgi:L-seryl-tRNA(Ser) seleniumtransferase
MEESNRTFVRMPELLEATGQRLATLLGTQAARITPGASAGIALGIAACLTGTDGRKSEQLPDVAGMKSAVLIQGRHRYKYDRMVRLTGARLVEVGNVNGTDVGEVEAGITTETAAILFPAHLDGTPGTVPLEEVTAVGAKHGVPTLVDAAYLNYPTATMSTFTERGADLVVFSAKYFGGPNAGGVICGRRDLIDAVQLTDFTRFESSKYLSFGRPFKLDRQIVVAVQVALEEWLTMNHHQRFEDMAGMVATIAQELHGVADLELTPRCFTMEETLVAEPVNSLRVRMLSGPLATDVSRLLAAGNPAILVHDIADALVIDVECMSHDEAQLVGRRVREAIGELRGESPARQESDAPTMVTAEGGRD